MHKGEIDIITLGCSKNLVDAERLMARLEAIGFRCVHDAEKPQGEYAIINTCGFIGDAKEESINTILQFVARKKKRQVRRLFVMGCLSERYLSDLEAEIPEVDGWYGKFNYEELLKNPYLSTPSEDDNGCIRPRIITTPKHYAYLKISEGCNRMCSYCAIPLITGRHKSVPMEELLEEVRWMVSQGVQEFNVIAQDLSSYGRDVKPHPTSPHGEEKKSENGYGLAELVDKMAEIEGVKWIRLHYLYPTDFPHDILPVMAKHANVCKYMDIALQHCTDHMLSLMRRHITREEQDALIRRIRAEVPGICLRTTLLVGHPGETEEDFRELCDWVREMRFDRMGAFAFSNEEGTYAYNHYQDDIPEEIKQQRVDEIMAIQQEISRSLMEEKVGQTLLVVIDREEADYYIGRSEYDSPDVDCEVLIPNDGTEALHIGEIYPIRITRAEEFDLYGELADNNTHQ